MYGPEHPGTGETDRDSIHRVDTLWDLILIYDELLDGLGLPSVPVIGSSFRGMMACELAALRPARVSKLVLIDPIGLWRERCPIAPYMMLSQTELVATLFHNLDAAPIREFLTLPSDPQELAVAMADSVWALGTTGKFVWPTPDKGLTKRLHRMTAPALIVWGAEDKLISPAYAPAFASAIPSATRVEIVNGAGHVPQWEQLDAVRPLVLD